VGIRWTMFAAIAGTVIAASQPASGTETPPLVVHVGVLVDGTGTAPRRDVEILVRDGRIVAVATHVDAPAGTERLDLGDLTVLPGFVDCHVHLTMQMDGDWANREVRQLPTEAAAIATTYARRTLEAGFTTVRNVGASDFADVGLRNAIRAGLVVGPRMLVATHAIGITGGHCDVNGFRPDIFDHEPDWRDGIVNSPDEARAAVRYAEKYGADVIKVCATGGVLSQGDAVGAQQLTEEELRAVVEEATRGGRRVAAHAHGTEGIKAAIRAGVTSIEHGSMLDDEAIRLMKEKGTFLVPTLSAAENVLAAADKGTLPAWAVDKARTIAPKMRASFRKAVQAGVKIALGTDSGVGRHGTNGEEFGLMVREGMTPMAAIQAGTRNAAELLGLEKEIGTAESGKQADLVAVRGDPLADIGVLCHPVLVLQGGHVVFDARREPVAGR